MRIPTVTLRRKVDGKIMKINAIDYASDLGIKRYSGWELVGEKGGDAPTETVVVKTAAGDTTVGKEEAEAMDTGVRATPRARAAQRKAGVKRADQRVDDHEL